MKRSKKLLLAMITFAGCTIVAGVIWWYLIDSSSVLISTGSEPHDVDDVNGLVTAGGYFVMLFADIAAAFAALLLLITIFISWKYFHSTAKESSN